MSRLGRNLPAYRQIASMWIQARFTYRVDLVFDVLTLLLQVFLLKVVWVAVYGGRGSVSGVELGDLIAFLTIANLQIWLMPTVIAGVLHDRVREGQIAHDLIRPVAFLDQLLMVEVGVGAGSVPLLVVILPLAMVVGGSRPPASPEAGVFYLISLGLAFAVSTLLDLLLGLSAFWTLEIEGLRTIYAFVSRFFAGALVPLWFFPPTLRAIANYLPFQAIAFVPVSIYLGKLEGASLVSALSLQLVWIAVLYLLARIVWNRAMRRVVVQGG